MSIKFYKHIKVMLLVLVATFLASASFAQALSGVKTIDPAGSGANNYVSFSSAIDSLNKYGVGTGGVTYNVAAGATFAETNALVLKATGTAANPIVFQKSGAGANPIINPALGTIATTTQTFTIAASGDAGLKIVGSDYLTIDGISIVESPGASGNAKYEYGIALLKAGAGDGNRFVTIKNCNVSLSRTTLNSIGIVSTTKSESFTSTTITELGRNENILITNNTLNNVYHGVYFAGSSSSQAHYDNDLIFRENTISNFTGGAATANGLYVTYGDSIVVAQNNVTLANTVTGQTAAVYGLNFGSGTNSKIRVDSNIVDFNLSQTTGAIYAIYNGGIGDGGIDNYTYYRYNNIKIVQTPTSSAAITSLINGVDNNSGAFSQIISGNTISGWSVGNTAFGHSGTITAITGRWSTNVLGSSTLIENNIVRDITRIVPATGTTVGGSFTGITASSTNATTIIKNNQIKNIVNPSSASTTIGITTSSTPITIKTIEGNVIDSLFTGGTINQGLVQAGSTCPIIEVKNNIIRGIASNRVGITSGTISGLVISSGITLNVFNNIVTDLTIPLSTSGDAIRGIAVNGGTTVNLSFNTVYMSGTGAPGTTTAGFGSSALYIGTVGTLNSKNNIFYNECTPAGAGIVSAVRRSAAGLTNYGSSSNNNLFYAGTPSATNLIFWDGVTATTTGRDQTLAAFKTRLAGTDQLSLTGTLSFVNTTTAPFDVHINTATATLVESAGQPVIGITTDFDGNTRNVNNPDIGADEGAFIAGADLQGPTINYTDLNRTSDLTNRTLSVTINDLSGVNTTAGTNPRVYYRIYKLNTNTVDNTYNDNTSGTLGWKYTETTSTSNPYTFTLDYSKLNVTPVVGDTIQYFVVAQDIAGAVNISSNAALYTTTPTSVALTAANFPITGNIKNYRLIPQMPAVITVGSGGTYPNLTAATTTTITGGAFEAINNAALTQDLTVQIVSSLDETGVVGLQEAFEEGAGAGTYKIKIVPAAASEDSIKGSFAGGLIRLNSADRVTFDGSYAGSGNYLVFANKNTTATSAAIQLTDNGGSVNGCENVVIKNSVFVGLTTTTQTNANYGISVGGGVGGVGRNHHNLTIDSNEFKGLKFGIYASGIAGSEFQNLKIRDNIIGNPDTRIRDKGIVVSYVNRARIFRNTIFGLKSISSSVSQSMAAIQVNAGTTNAMIDRNNIYDISFTGTGGYDARGITVGSSALSNNDTIYANTISWIRNDGWSSLFDGAVGLAVEGGDRIHVYNNSINMFGNLTSTTRTSTTQTAGIWVAGGTNINVKNNLVYNTLKNPNATGAPLMQSYGIFISGTAGAGGAIASLDNNNYATDGTPQSIVAYVNGTKYNTLLDHQLATNRDKNSFAEVPKFVDSINLHINTGTIGTLLESHGQIIPGVNRDIDNQLRPGPVGSVNGGALTFDIGADEFDGNYLADIFPPTILVDSISPSVDNCRPVAHTVYARITDLSGIDTAEIRHSVNGVAQPTFLMTALGSGRYSGTIPAQIPGAQVILSIYAQDSLNNSVTKAVDTFVDARFNFTVKASEDTVAAGNTFQLDALLPSTVKQIGTGTLTTTFVPNPYYTGWWGNKGQHLITAAELTAQGFIAGNITSLGLNVFASTALPMNNFTIRMASTSLTNLSASFVTTGFSQVFTTPVLNLVANSFNNHIFQTPFYWDGVSNIIIETCFNNSSYAGTAAVEYTTTSNVSNTYYYDDAPDVCAASSGATSSNRPNFILGQPLTATYTWTSTANGGLQSTNIRNPLATPTGAPGLYSYILTSTNGSCSWTDTVDVMVVAAVTPSASFRTDTTIAVSGNTPTEVSVINGATNFPNTWNYEITPSNFEFIKGTNANSKAPKFIFNRAGQYTIKQVVTNAAGSDSLVRSNYITVTLDYCRPTVSSTFQYTHINSFKLKTLTNTSGQTTGAYNNYTDSLGFVVPQLEAGRSDTITFRLGAGSFTTNNTTTAWIDYNQDGAFTKDEILGNAFGVAAINTDARIIFKAPYKAVAGPTRLRIRNSAFGAANTPLPPCGSTSYGETEDYTVNISPAPLMAVQNVKLEQDTVAVLPATTDAVVLRSKVIVTGYTSRLSLTSLSLSTTGTTSLSDITNIKVYYTANKDTFNTNTLFGSGTPASTLTINGSALLEGDTNYFWVAYDVASAAVVGNAMDAAITSMTIGGTAVTPNITSPAGDKKILLQAVPTSLVAYEPFGAIPVYSATKGNPIIAAKISMTNGVISQINELKFELSSTTNYQNIDKLYLVYTRGDSTFRSSYKEQFGQVPGNTLGTLTFTDTINLVAGNNYFWLVADATSSPGVGDTLDASFLSAKLQGRTIDTSTVKTTTSLRKFAAFPINGCTSAATSPADEDIGYVQVGNFINQSAATLITNSNPDAVNLYSNFGSLQGLNMQVEVPISYQVNVINFGANLYTSTVNVFVDLNQNGTFDLPKERVAKQKLSNIPSDRIASGNIKLPIGTKGGNTVMRVVAIETSNTNDTLPACSTYTWGETEDYIVTVSPAPPGDYYAPIVSNITLTPDSSCTAVAHTISATVKDTTGIDSVLINWTKDGIAQTAILMSNGGTGDVYSGIIPAQGKSVVRFSLLAQDNSPRANEITTKSDVYRDEYLKAALNAGPDGYVAAGNGYQIDGAIKREPKFGNGTSASSVYNFYRFYGGEKVQYIFTAAELQASGLTAGAITALAWSTNLTQGVDTMKDYSISVGNTTETSLTAGFITTGLTNVIPTMPTYLPGAGGYANATQNFVTPFIWDGTSNVVIQVLWNNNDGGTPSSSTNCRTYYTSGYPTGTTRYYAVDNLPTSDIASSVTGGFATTIRPDMMLKQGLPYTYNWTQSTNGGLSALNIPNPIATPTGGVGAYQYVVTVNDGTCSALDTVEVNVLPIPTVDLGAATGLICGSTPRLLDAGNPDAASYAWYVNNVLDANTNRTMLASTAGVYKVVVRDRAGQIATDSINFTVGAAFTYNIGADTLGLCVGGTRTLDPGTYPSYLWSTGATTRTLAVSTTGIYSLTVSNAGGCIATDTFTVVSVAPTTVSLGADQAICTSAPLTLDAGNAGATYLWSTGATTQTIQAKFAGNYSVIVNTVTGCTLYDTIVITNLPAPAVSIGPDFQLCPGSTSVLDAGNAGNTFLWSTGATTQTLTISSAGTYYVTVTGANGCSTNDTIVVTPKTAPVVSLGADQNICTSDTVTLDAGNAGATYLWSTGATTQTIRVSLANTYSVAVTNVGGCTTNDAVVITNKAVPVSTFTTQVVDTTKGQQVKFTAVSAAGTSYAWNFGDPTSASNTSSLSTPTHLFSAPGNYTVTLTVTNVATGCKSVTQTVVSVTGLANDFAKAFKLVAAPNPFAGNTKINYELPSNANVTLEVYDMIGRKVSTIANSAYQESGVHTYDFSAGDNQNASGVYMVRLIVDGQVAILRVIDIANR